ncbi:AraC family transcriptional regulator [Pectinatus haikarae]|uniref:AraC-like DNA-binding protein/mannose-6-phosphate isomerase-like protein (Cupin superfamily) n=1 Tax=Pectinatus haikarae TaxID=349096 RepID=A0ABT9Y5N7_9FIRM|nr:AraC family transcriptional regulator [Pectinatus haikarae]MDQ0203148.1 AraC-like DNA-binding protein/mannose-6-phosphate isomerase-like protein (cupin superfamily) [Pectinatus haikarae]
MCNYEKRGYLAQQFKIFRIRDYLVPLKFHYHAFHKIILFISGSVTYTVEGKSYPLMPRDIIFVSAGEIHRPLPTGNELYERIVIYISPEILQKYSHSDENLAACFTSAAKHSSVMHLPPGKSHDLTFHVKKLEQNFYAKGFANDLYSEILFVEFMILLNRALLSHEIDEMHAAVYDKKVLPILKHINDNLFTDLSIDILSGKFFISKFHMMRRFKKATGYSIHQYITNKRLLRARAMIHSDIPLTKICFDCGFHDYSTFSRAFKDVFKQTPREYRRKLFLEQ